MIKVAHVITGLGVGGAETMLSKLVSVTDRSAFDPVVISLQDVGPIGEKIQKQGISVRACNMNPSRPDPAIIWRLSKMLKEEKPHIVQTWLYHADLIGGIACKLSGRSSLLWNIRHSHLDPATIKKSTIVIGKMCARLSGILPQKILCCSEVGKDVHIKLGYRKDKMLVIPNGFNLQEYVPSLSARCEVREELNIPQDAFVICHAGRFHPMKDHSGIVQAAARLFQENDTVYIVMCGDNVDWNNTELSSEIKSLGIEPRFRLLGRRTDLPRINAAADISTLFSQYGEGFPNVVGEAMACGTPCVVTDVGDSGYIVGETGLVIQPGDRDALISAWKQMISLSPEMRRDLGHRARQRVSENFDITVVVKRYEDVYKEVVSNHG